MPIFAVSETEYEFVYDALSFTFASMMATTLFLWFRVPAVHEKYKTPLLISGLVTFIASYHYIRIFNSWTGAYEYAKPAKDSMNDFGEFPVVPPTPTGVPFNDAYRYMDWLLTVPLLLMEIVLVMKLDRATSFRKSLQLGVSSAVMIVIGYPGELILEADMLWKRWIFWAAALVPFIYIVYELTVGLKSALDMETDENIKSKIWYAQRVTIISWLTYPIVYIIPMLEPAGGSVVMGIQIGYCLSDIISKCGVGLVIYQITLAKSRALQGSKGGYTEEEQPLLQGQ